MSIGDLKRLNSHGERRLIPLSKTASPLNSALRGLGATANPVAELDLHWGLWVVVATIGITTHQATDLGAINGPREVLWGPINGVLVEAVLWLIHRVIHSTVVGGGVALAVVVGLDGSVVAADPLPVDLVEGRGLEDEGGDDAAAVGGLHDHLNLAVEDVPFRLDSWGVGLLLDHELGALRGVLEGGTWEGEEVLGGSLGEVDVDAGTEGNLSWAGWRNR